MTNSDGPYKPGGPADATSGGYEPGNNGSQPEQQQFGQRPPESRPDPSGQAVPQQSGYEAQAASGGAGFSTPPRSAKQILQPRDVPPPPKRSRMARNQTVVFLNFLMSLLVFGALAGGAAFWVGKLRFEETGPLTKARTVIIEEGSGLNTIAGKLQSAGIISSDFIFSHGVKAYNAAGDLKAGEYAFKPGMSMRQVMETIRSGKGIVHKVSIPEGLTSFQIMQRLAANDTLEGALPETIPPEGSLMPDTYPFQRGTTRQEIIDQMEKAQQRFINEVWDRRIDGLPVTTPEEMITLASIVEKETGKADERPRVASVFINRLNKGMRLQSDPTIIYGLFGGEGKPKDRPIYRSDIEKETPYNTYVINGLPPTPIANPGRAALEAVANPSRTEDLYFVADGSGGHVFSKTLEEHNANVTRWRAIEKRLQEEAEKAAAEAEKAAAEAEKAAAEAKDAAVKAGEAAAAADGATGDAAAQ